MCQNQVLARLPLFYGYTILTNCQSSILNCPKGYKQGYHLRVILRPARYLIPFQEEVVKRLLCLANPRVIQRVPILDLLVIQRFHFRTNLSRPSLEIRLIHHGIGITQHIRQQRQITRQAEKQSRPEMTARSGR